MIEFGSKVKDIVTGFKGTVTGKCEYLNGCVQYCVTPKMKNDKRPSGEWIDDQQLVVLKNGEKKNTTIDGNVLAKIVKKGKTGGPSGNPPKAI